MSFAYTIHNDEPGFDAKDFFSQKKLVASYKAFVVLSTGNERGSDPVTVVRPV